MLTRLGERWTGLGWNTRGWVLAALCLSMCLAMAMQQWVGLRLGGFDLSIFHEAVRSYANFELPRAEIKTVHHQLPPGFNLLGDHFSPIYALLAPLYWVWEDPRMLLLAQAVLFAAGVPVVRTFARRLWAPTTLPSWAPDAAGLVYALGWPLLAASRSGFHEVAFAVPLTLVMFERAQARSYRWMAAAALGLCVTKEDLGLMVGAFGLVMLLRSRRSPVDRAGTRWSLVLLVGGPLLTALAIAVLIPAMGGVSGYYWDYTSLGTGPKDAVLTVLTHPWLAVSVALDHPAKWMLLLFLFGPLLFVPLRSLTSVAAVPLLAERLYSENTNHWVGKFHYDAFLWPILVIAAIEAFWTMQPVPRKAGRAIVALTVTATLAAGAWSLFLPWRWSPSDTSQGLIDAAARIPDGASAEATNFIAPRLTPSHYTVLVDQTPRCQDYVVVRSDGKASWPLEPEEIQARIELLLSHGYEVVFDQDGALLLRRTAGADVPGCAMPTADSTPYKDVIRDDPGWWIF